MKSKLIFIVLFSSIFPFAYGSCQVIGGFMHCKDIEQNMIDFSGVVSLQQVEISQKTLVRGQLIAYQSDLNEVDVKGNAEFIDSSIIGLSKIKGV